MIITKITKDALYRRTKERAVDPNSVRLPAPSRGPREARAGSATAASPSSSMATGVIQSISDTTI